MNSYTLQEFYLYLKLGIWVTGIVDGWGLVRQAIMYPDGMTDKGCFITKKPNEYKDELQQNRQQLSIGLQLLDMYPLEERQTNKYNNKYKIYTHLAVVGDSRLRGAYEEQIYYLKITNNDPITIFRTKIYDSKQMEISASKRNNRSTILRKERRVSRIDTSPLNSVSRKH